MCTLLEWSCPQAITCLFPFPWSQRPLLPPGRYPKLVALFLGIISLGASLEFVQCCGYGWDETAGALGSIGPAHRSEIATFPYVQSLLKKVLAEGSKEAGGEEVVLVWLG